MKEAVRYVQDRRELIFSDVNFYIALRLYEKSRQKYFIINIFKCL